MKILYVNHYGKTISGAERVMLNLASLIVKKPDAEIVALCPRGALQKELSALGIRVETTEFVKFRRTANPVFWASAFLSFCNSWINILSLIRKYRFDILYSNSYVAHLYSCIPARTARLKNVWHMHDILKPVSANKTAVGFASKYSAGAIAVSDAVKDNLISLGADPSKIHTVLNGIDLDAFDRRAAAGLEKELPPASPGELTVAMVGQIAYFKGQHTFVDAALRILRDGAAAKLRFIIAGGVQDDSEKEYARELSRKVEKAGAADRILFLGPRGDVPALLAASDIVVHASATPDPCPLAVIEYLYSGKAVVASRTGGVPELVSHGETGFLFWPGSVEELSEYVTRLAGDENLRARMGAAAKRQAKEVHSLKVHADKVYEILRNIASED